MLVRGVDLLGQPFEERTVTVNLNLHGCRYASKYQLPRNSWVTLEFVSGEARRNVRARVAWILRPHSVRDFFQVAVELEGPANIWGVETPPADWMNVPISHEFFISTSRGAEAAGETSVNFTEGPSVSMSNQYAGNFEMPLPQGAAPFAPQESSPQFGDRFNQQDSGLGERSGADANESSGQGDLLAIAMQQFERLSGEIRALMDELEGKTAALRAENESASVALEKLTEARLRIGSLEGSMGGDFEAPAPRETADRDMALWRERLAYEMSVAQAQWGELLQSSLDRGMQRLAEELPERTGTAIRAVEDKVTGQIGSLSQVLSQVNSEAQGLLANIRASVDQELRTAQEAMRDTSQQALEILSAEVEMRVAPHVTRIPEIVRELSAREERASESLRLHRERLRQMAETALREIGAQAEAASTAVRDSLAGAKSEILAKWNEDLEANGSRVVQSTSDAIGRTAEWFQQEASSRLQVAAEQNLASVTSSLQEEMAKASAQFATSLEGQSVFYLAQVREQLDGLSNELTGHARSQFSEAAEAAASAFGQVIHGMSESQAQQFAETTQGSLAQTKQELDWFSRQIRSNLETDSGTTLEQFRGRLNSEIDTALLSVRTAMANESAVALDAHRAQHTAHHQEVTDTIGRMANEVFAQCNDRLQTAADSWTVASVRRLNEHGQNVIESLTRAADQALRESASRIFDGLAATLRHEGANASGVAAGANQGATGPLGAEAQAEPLTPQGQENYNPQGH